jgi:pimeloyl-ACP methyl ester carboxylesterase
MAKLQRHTPPPGWKSPLAPQQPLANPRWLVTGLAATLALAVVCVYIAFCLLFWQGQWQLVFKPSPAITATPASIGLQYDDIAFDATETGVLQLNGWWIPAGTTARYTGNTLLFMHDGFGSLSATVPQLLALHQLGINVFAFDYRGFGKSAHLHPSEASTHEDADAAWNYLVDTRHLSPSSIVLDGVGLGAAIAAESARRHPQAPAVILEDPRPPVLDGLQSDGRLRLLPVRLLFHDRFDPANTLAHLRTPKLLLYSARARDGRYYDQAAQPKEKASLQTAADYVNSLRSFLSTYLTAG